MRFEEALSLMRAGAKMRLSHWGNGTHVKFDNDLLVWNHGVSAGSLTAAANLTAAAISSVLWEKVRTPWREELKDGSFAEALVGLMRGEKWRRAGWEGHLRIGPNGDCVLLRGDSCPTRDLPVGYLTATDWERVVP